MKRKLTITEEDLDAALKCDWSESTCLLAQTIARELNEEVIGLDYDLTVTTMKGKQMTHWNIDSAAHRIMRLFDHAWSPRFKWPVASIQLVREWLPFEFKIEQVSTVDVRQLISGLVAEKD